MYIVLSLLENLAWILNLVHNELLRNFSFRTLFEKCWQIFLS